MYKSKCYVYLGFYFLHTHWNQHKERKKSCMLQLNFLVFGIRFHSVHAKLLQCCPTPCDPMDCSQPDSSVHGMLQARILELDCHSLLQGIFPSHRWSLHLLWFLHCRCILYCWALPGSQSFAASCCKKFLQKFFSNMPPFTWNAHREHTFLLDIFNLVMNKTDQSSYWLLFFFLTISLLNTCWFLLCGCFHGWNILQLFFWWPQISKIVAGLFAFCCCAAE